MKEMFEKGPWFVEYELVDGARISRLCYRGFDLLTTAPNQFKPPSNNFGQYETRPVYGYDDCFPSVESCKYPGIDWVVPDHGELCWLEWDAEVQKDKIVFSVESKVLPIIFKRTMQFRETQLNWNFEVQNRGDKNFPFQHVMHPLLKLTEIKDLKLPNFSSLNTEAGEEFEFKTSKALRDYLLSREVGEAHMFYLQNPKENFVEWTYKNDLQVRMVFPAEIFSSIGIWWNCLGYPNEAGLRRDECAFEPVSGSSSKLDVAYDEGRSLFVEPNGIKSWNIVWEMK